MRPLAAALLLATAAATSSCAVPLVMGAGAAAGYVGLQSRPTAQIAEDTKVKLSIKDSLSRIQFAYLTDVGVDVFYGDVLLTGILPGREDGEKVLDIARRTVGVKKVYNELFIGAAYSTAQKAKDAWIAAQLQPRLVGDSKAYPLNYLISVVNGHVYILGSAGSTEEYQHVLHILSTTSGVKQVHDYIVLQQSTPEGNGNTATGGNHWFSKASVQGQAPDPLKVD